MVLQMKELFAEMAKGNLSEGGKISQKQGCQISDKAIDTKRELAKIAGMSLDTFILVKVILML